MKIKWYIMVDSLYFTLFEFYLIVFKSDYVDSGNSLIRIKEWPLNPATWNKYPPIL